PGKPDNCPPDRTASPGLCMRNCRARAESRVRRHQGETAMIEIDPEAEYTAAQVATLLHIPESLAQGLWQQWPVCGYDMLGYCHRQHIPYSIRPLAPESKIGRALRFAQVRSENRTEQELFPMREHYRRMMPEERERFANLIRSLATTTDEFSVSDIY